MSMRIAERSALMNVLRAALLGCCAATAVVATAPGAQAQTASNSVSYNIPAGSLGSALTKWAQASGLKLLASGGVLQGRSTGGLSGAYEPYQALGMLLAGSGLTYSSSGTTVTIADPNAGGNQAGASVDGAIPLDTIDVSGGQSNSWEGNPDQVYATPAGVSVVTGQDIAEKFGGNADNALRSTPGAFTRMAESSAGIAVNIRGFEGFNRVNMMIDGVRQNFRVFGHGMNGGNAFVDPSLLAGVDIARGSVIGASGVGALAGSANFRTLDVDDILMPGRDWGLLETIRVGTNGYNASVMSAGAIRRENTSASIAVSHRGSNDYRDGDGKVATGTAEDLTSGVAKLNFGENQPHRLSFGAVWYDNDTTLTGASFPIENQTYTAKYRFVPNSDLVDLRVNAYYNVTEATFTSNINGQNAPVQNKGLGVDVTNTSRVALSDAAAVTFDYGAAYYRDDVDNGGSVLLSIAPGQQDVAGAFASARLNWKMLEVIGGLKYDYYAITGTSEAFLFPAAPGVEIENSSSAWSPKLTVAITPLDWLQLYGTYEHSFRPPSVSETMFPGAHGTRNGAHANPNLRGERSKGWEAGVNIRKDGLLLADDSFRFKANYFQSDIRDYVAFDITDFNTFRIQFTNLPGVTPISGVELQGSYDVGVAYANVSYTTTDILLPQGIYTGSGAGDLGLLPEDYLTVDLGVRLFDKKLTLGGQMRWIGESLRTNILSFPIRPPLAVDAYKLFDVYANYQANENVNLFVNAENVTDVMYQPALKSHTGDPGPGRRVVGGISLRF
ncbi:TonB-dependent receptor [Hyphomicrobium sp. D-2]|uniref:TonB-dependent receptor n=1 Tax=Hyphomicrobium sp. D-2 TaxID=3041621 RepID=UPI0024558C26|nr:TonB-dependent receptor [Hyphomicrobium sp. D-2]MDH4983714.1 TonB-dependent receptor [Hyphomicrobium sp. D-2]